MQRQPAPEREAPQFAQHFTEAQPPLPLVLLTGLPMAKYLTALSSFWFSWWKYILSFIGL